MSETTSHDEELSREEAAAFLRSVADELDSGREVIEVPIGNKGVKLSPPNAIDSEATVIERSRRLRKDIEKLSLEFTWNPAADTVESESEAEVDETTESDAGPGTDPEPETSR